jgi:hypothetical protein
MSWIRYENLVFRRFEENRDVFKSVETITFWEVIAVSFSETNWVG